MHLALGTRYTKWVHAAYDAGLFQVCAVTPELCVSYDEPRTRAAAACMMVRAKWLSAPLQGLRTKEVKGQMPMLASSESVD